MPPIFALLIGAGFVCYAFLTARKRVVNEPVGLFWPSLWYMVVASRMVGLWLGIWGVSLPGDFGDPTEGSLIDRWFFLTLTIIGFVILWRRHFRWGAALGINPWIVALFAFMALSILWSGYSFVSFKRYIKVLGSLAMALVVLTNEQPLESIFTVLRRCLYIHLPMSIICIKYFRDIGVSYDWSGTANAWQGISTSKNTLGQVAMLAVLYFAWDIYRHWKRYGWRNLHVLYLLMAIYLLKGSEDEISLTAVSACALTVLVFLRLQTLRSRIESARRFARVTFRVIVGLTALIIVHSIVIFSEDSLFGQMITKFGRDITLTDRIYIWHDVYAAASGNPLLGIGFGGFWIGRIANIPWNANMSWVLGQAHNGYVDTYLQIGLVGESLLVIVLFTAASRLVVSLDEDFDFNCFRFALLIAIMFVNITESTYLRGDHHLWFIMLLVILRVPRSVLSVANPGQTIGIHARDAGEPLPVV